MPRIVLRVATSVVAVLRFLVYHVDTSGNKSVSRPDAACLLP